MSVLAFILGALFTFILMLGIPAGNAGNEWAGGVSVVVGFLGVITFLLLCAYEGTQ